MTAASRTLASGQFSRTALLLAAVALIVSACGKPTAAESGAAKDSSGAPAEGPATALAPGGDSALPAAGQTDSATSAVAAQLTFTAAQVAFGGVKWAAVTAGTTATLATIPGEVTPNEDRTSRLGAPGRGRIVNVRVQPGQRVTSGQVLVVLQSPEASVSQADVTKAAAEVTSWQARAKYADAARSRAARLLALKAIPLQDYERSIVDDEEAHASLVQATSELARARTTATQLGAGAASPAGEFVVRAPRSGVVLTRTAAPGAVVDAGSPLITVTDPSSLWLSMNAAEQFALLFRSGQTVRFTVPSYPTDTFTARIDAVGAGLDPATRTLTVRGVINNARDQLKPQMLASVLVAGGTTVPAVTVPDEAVQLIAGKPNIFLARPDGKGGVRFERREVELGSRASGRVAVTRGLSGGETIVTAGAFAVKAEFEKGTISSDD